MGTSARVDAEQRAGPHVLLYGLFGIGNTGNDETLAVALEFLKAALPHGEFTIVGSNLDEILTRFPPPVYPIKPQTRLPNAWPRPLFRLLREADRWRMVRRLIARADCLLVPGTGILDDFGSADSEQAYRLWMWTRLAAHERVPVKFVSIGAGPVVGARSREFFAKSAALADHRSYREPIARDYVRDVFKVDVANDVVTPDLVFGIDFDPPPIEGPLRTVGLGVMNYHSWHGAAGAGGDIHEDYIRKFIDIGRSLIDRGLEIVLLTGEPADEPAARAVERGLIAYSDQARVALAPIRTLRHVCVAASRCQAVIATRYHNIVSALICGRPAISIGYGPKNRAVMTSFGLMRFCQDVNTFSPATAVEHLFEATADLAAEHSRILARARDLRSEVHTHLASVTADIVAIKDR